MQVLLVTEMRRSESVVHPDLFHYHDHFDFLGLIGKTKFSEVFRVRHRQTKEIFAVKRSRRGFRTKLQRERCLREIRAVAALPAHPHIVGQYRAWQEAGHFYIQMDYCESGSLDQLLYPAAGPAPLSTEALWGVAADIATGLDFLHAHDVLHLDIKPENLYRNSDVHRNPGPWRIGDFGLAVAKESTDWEEGDGDYVAPELLRTGCEPTSAADVFSLGATLYECATGEKLPRKESSPDAADVEIPGKPEALQILIRAMLLTDPNERPLAGQVAAYAKAHLEREISLSLGVAGTPKAADGAELGEEDFAFTAPAAEEEQGVTPRPLSAESETEPGSVDPHESGIGLLGAPSGRGSRWIPALSPLLSEGALTPGAAASLMGLTPPSGGAPASVAPNKARPLPIPPPPDPSSARLPAPRGGPPARVPSYPPRPPSRNGSRLTDPGSGSFKIHRRDMKSSSSDLLGSASESEPFSFSCECDAITSASELEFPDFPTTLSRGGTRRLSDMSLAWEMHSSPDWQGYNAGSRSHTPIPAPLFPGEDSSGPRNIAAASGSAPRDDLPSSRTVQHDRQCPRIGEVDDTDDTPCPSPMSIPFGSAPNGYRISNAPVPRFPLLDDAVENSIPQEVRPASAKDRLAAQAPFPLSIISPFESILAGTTGQPTSGTGSHRSPPISIVPPLDLPSGTGPLRRKRQHSSRRALVHALREGSCDLTTSRSVDYLCSSRSIQDLMPLRKGARRGGAFHHPGDEDGGGGGDYAEEEALPVFSGQSTHRSYHERPPSPRILGLASPCNAASAAARMTHMTLDDAIDAQ